MGLESLFLTIKNDLLSIATNSCVLSYLRRCILKIKILTKEKLVVFLTCINRIFLKISRALTLKSTIL